MTQFEDVPLDQLLYTVDDACHLLSIKRTKVFALLQEGQLPSITIGRARRIPRSALIHFASRGTA